MAGVITAAAISTVGGYLGAKEQANAATEAANTSANASKYAQDLQYKMWQEQQALQKPWQEAGVAALNKLVSLASDYQKFGMSQFQQDPGYAFRLKEGLRALDQSAAARGGLISGNALKAAQRYGQEMGSQEYNNAFTRYLREREAQLNPLQSLAGLGQTSAQTMGAGALNTGQTIGNYGMTSAANQGNALLAGAAGRSSAYQGMGTNLGYALSNQNNWNKLSNWWNSPSSGGVTGPSIGSNAYNTQDAYAAQLNAAEGF